MERKYVREQVCLCACVCVIVPFSLAAGAATPGQAGGESERGVGSGGAAAGETVWYMRLSLATLRHTRIRRFNKDITQTK